MHVVLNDPVVWEETEVESFLAVGFTTIRDALPYDKSCELDVGAHPFVVVPTYVAYRYAKIIVVGDLDADIAKRNARRGADQVSEPVFARILRGLAISRAVAGKIRRFARRHVLPDSSAPAHPEAEDLRSA